MPRITSSGTQDGSEESRRIEEEECRWEAEVQHIWDNWPRENGRIKLILVNPKKSPHYR